MIKRVISIALALVMLIGVAALMPTAAKAAEYSAALGLTASDWSASTGFGAESTVQTTVTGDGTYTLTYTGACLDLGILVVDVIGAQAALDAENKTYQVSDLALTVDGNAVAVDAAKIVTGDLESNGNFRIELHNMYGSTKDAPAVDAATTVAESLSLTFTLTTVDKGAQGGDAPAGVPTEFDVFIAYGGDKAEENDWLWQYYGADVEGITPVNGKLKVGETVTVSLTFETPNVNSWFFSPCLIADGVSAIAAMDFSVVCKIDGTEVAVDMAADAAGKTWWLEDTGDYKGNCVRLAGGYNEWGTKYIAEPAGFTTIEYTITLNSVSDTAAGGTDTPADPPQPTVTFDPTASYDAYLLLQTPSWTYRNAWNDATGGMDSEFWGDFIYGNETKQTYGKVTDTAVNGNGTYSVKITDFGTIFADDFAAAGQEYFNILGVSTNIPLSDDIKITDVKMIVDGSTKVKYAEAYLDPDATDYVKILVQNIWNDDVKETTYYPVPTESLEIQFTISGFSYDNPDQQEPQATNPPASQPQATEPGGSEGGDPTTAIIIAVVAVIAVATVVVVVVMKKKKS